jgi:Na+-transporting NADH:ubiquinone oxidoreductase subunit NqrB
MSAGDIVKLAIFLVIFVPITLFFMAPILMLFYEAWKEARWTGLLIASLLLPLILFWFYGWNPFT